MPAPGIVYKDLMPLPDNVEAATNPDKKEVAHSLTQQPTDSHALAYAHTEEKGAAQMNEDGVKDLGWNEPNAKIANPLVGGLDNEELWVLIRRFNKVGAASSGEQELLLMIGGKCTMSRNTPTRSPETSTSTSRMKRNSRRISYAPTLSVST